MGKINGCLKCVFIFFNVLFLLQGCGMIFLVASLHFFCITYHIQLSALGMPGIGWFWLFALGIISVSSLGIFAACCEKNLALKIFAGLMGIGMLVMLIVGISVVVKRNQIKTAFLSTSSDLVKPYMTTPGITDMIEALQKFFECCGIGSAEDWGDEIPDSCGCSSSTASSKCKSRPSGTSGPFEIYSLACGEHVFGFLDYIFQLFMAFFFVYAVTALLGLLITLWMIHQVRRNNPDEPITMEDK
ncbi:tetraspanin-9 [Archocentrus centrarchus]|uniref:tetraspanin-9 n=1 Tax=Archocentrus centrarchus TaxID=63155 RepID=UPI0011EA35A1|nr:CD63 antigen-like [Archocentrus centrarchus]